MKNLKRSLIWSLWKGSLNYILAPILFLLAYSALDVAHANTDALARWHLRHELAPLVPAGISGLKAVAFGNGSWVAAGSSGAILSTPDPDTVPWTARTNSVIQDAAFGNGIFVAVGNEGAILTSVDGLGWARQQSRSRSTILHVIHAQDRFVAAGQSEIFSSADGVTWANHSPPGDGPIGAIGHGDGTFVLAAGPNVWASNDLVSRKAAISISFNGIAQWSGNAGRSTARFICVTSRPTVKFTLQQVLLVKSFARPTA